MRQIKLSKLFILGGCVLTMALVSFASVSVGPAPAVNDLVGGSLACGLGYGVAGGLTIGAFFATGTIFGAPAGLVLGVGGALIGVVTTAFCAT